MTTGSPIAIASGSPRWKTVDDRRTEEHVCGCE